MFEKCGINVSEHVIREKVYSYLVDREWKFYDELRDMSETAWRDKVGTSKTISQDILGEIEKTALSIGFTLEDVLQMMAENEYITKLRSRTS